MPDRSESTADRQTTRVRSLAKASPSPFASTRPYWLAWLELPPRRVARRPVAEAPKRSRPRVPTRRRTQPGRARWPIDEAGKAEQAEPSGHCPSLQASVPSLGPPIGYEVGQQVLERLADFRGAARKQVIGAIDDHQFFGFRQ